MRHIVTNPFTVLVINNIALVIDNIEIRTITVEMLTQNTIKGVLFFEINRPTDITQILPCFIDHRHREHYHQAASISPIGLTD